MKKILFIVFLFPFISFGQNNILTFGTGGGNNISPFFIRFQHSFGYSENTVKPLFGFGASSPFGNSDWAPIYAVGGVRIDGEIFFGQVKVGNVYDGQIGFKVGDLAIATGVQNYRNFWKATKIPYENNRIPDAYFQATYLINYWYEAGGCYNDSWGQGLAVTGGMSINPKTKNYGIFLGLNLVFGE
jgi:hypothetical protein